MKKLISFALAAAWLAAPVYAGNDASQTTNSPSVEQKTDSMSQRAPAPGSAADKKDDVKKGLGRNPEDCNKGCIGGNPL